LRNKRKTKETRNFKFKKKQKLLFFKKAEKKIEKKPKK